MKFGLFGGPRTEGYRGYIDAVVEAEALPESDPRRGVLLALAETLFERHWLEWWRPVCAAAGLPEPHVPGKRRPAAAGTTMSRSTRCRPP